MKPPIDLQIFRFAKEGLYFRIKNFAIVIYSYSENYTLVLTKGVCKSKKVEDLTPLLFFVRVQI